MSRNLPPLGMAMMDEHTAMLETGSRASGTEVFYWLVQVSTDGGDEARWSQQIPDGLGLVECEYVAFIEGLRAARESDYSMAEIATNSPPILDQLREGEHPPSELEPFYETAVQLVEQFDAVRLTYYSG